jgi:hypothetical protein
MLDTCRLASYWPKGQGVEGYEAAKGDFNRPDRYLYHRHYGGTGYEERPLRGTNPSRPYGGRCLHSLRIC